nr:diguanylate cyclase [Aliarcobacter sp.]
MPKSFKNYILLKQIILVTIVFLICFIFSTYIHTSLTKKEALKQSDAISNQIFSSMYQVMKKGWSKDDVRMFTKSLEDSFVNSNYEINIYRTQKVKDIFGEIEEKQKDITLVNVLNGEIKKFENFENNIVRTITPLKAKPDCMSCHINVKEGDILGALEVTQDLNSVFSESKYQFIAFFLIIIPLFYISAFLSSRYTSKQIISSLTLFNNKVENINSIQDFKEFDSKNIDLYFNEFNEIIKNVDLMANKLKVVAVDKELLEFEVKLLDKFIITSDVVKDWREYICELLIEINKIMETYTLMTIFRVGEDQFEVDIFWLGMPQEEQKKIFEKYIHKTIKESDYFQGFPEFPIKHIIADTNKCISHVEEKEIEYRSKSLFLDSPKIGGIVGIGLESVFSNDPIRYIVIDSILTTMANLVGSVKAIHKYTQDLEYYAARDPLTNLFNQRVFNDMMAYEIKRAAKHDYPFALMIIDCDNFKPINDNFGHAFGDKFLQTVADILEEEKRDGDIVARYGGDEFTIILPECDENGAMTVARRIASRIENTKLIAPDNSRVGITISSGICVYPIHTMSQTDMFIIADSMMYQAKEEGKNSVKIPDLKDVSKILKINQEKSSLLIKAIENDQIEAYFQPIKPSSLNNNLVIHELLMRINQDGKIISAFEFIEIAESRGLINTMDLMVIEKAFIKIKESNYEGILFINLSPKSLIMGDFINKINN